MGGRHPCKPALSEVEGSKRSSAGPSEPRRTLPSAAIPQKCGKIASGISGMFMRLTLYRDFPRAVGLAVVFLSLSALALAAAQTASISISPTYAVVQLGQQLTFTATGNNDVTWQVDNANGGNSTAGMISSTGVYTAPSTMPN